MRVIFILNLHAHLHAHLHAQSKENPPSIYLSARVFITQYPFLSDPALRIIEASRNQRIARTIAALENEVFAINVRTVAFRLSEMAAKITFWVEEILFLSQTMGPKEFRSKETALNGIVTTIESELKEMAFSP